MSDPNVYFAGPIDYIEHRSPGTHVRDNWRHRFFEDLPINLLCPTCLNRGSKGASEVMRINAEAQRIAAYFVGYFPGDQPTFGTPIEIWNWFNAIDGNFEAGEESAVLVHPAKPGVYVEILQESGLVVVRSFPEARSWLQHRLTQR